MKKFLHPSFGTIILHLIIFFLIIDAALIVIYTYRIKLLAIIIGVFVLLLIYALYIIYCLIDYLLNYLKPFHTLKELIGELKENRYKRRIFTSYIGCFVNFGMMVFYVVYFYIRPSFVYFASAQFFFLAFLGRIILLYHEFKNEPGKENTWFMVSSAINLLLAFGMITITTLIINEKYTVSRNFALVYLLCIYGFSKMISAIVSFRSSLKEKNLTLLSLSLYSFSLACYSLFMLSITIPISLNRKIGTGFAYCGYSFSAVIAIIAVIYLIYGGKLRKREKERKEENTK